MSSHLRLMHGNSGCCGHASIGMQSGLVQHACASSACNEHRAAGQAPVIAMVVLTALRGIAGKVAQLAQGEIDRLAKAYGGRSVPAHVTLMGGIVDDEQGINDRAALLSSQLKARRIAH